MLSGINFVVTKGLLQDVAHIDTYGCRSVADCGLDPGCEAASGELVWSLDKRALGPAVSGRSPAGGLGA